MAMQNMMTVPGPMHLYLLLTNPSLSSPCPFVTPKAPPTIGGTCCFRFEPFLIQFSSVQFSHSVVCNSLQPQDPHHARPPCPSPNPRAYPNSCPLNQWCHPTISSSVVPFSSCLQSLPASVSFQISQLFSSGGQSTEVSPSTSVLPMNTQDWSALGWTCWISL